MTRIPVLQTLVLVAMMFAIGCGGKTEQPAVSVGGFDGFNLTEMPGTDLQRATRLSPTENVEEEGYVRNGARHGMWILYHADGHVKTVCNYVDGKLDGLKISLDARGQIIEKQGFKEGEPHGMHVTYRFGRAQEEIPYDMGTVHGKVMRYYGNNKIKESIEFVNGKQHGYYRHYNEQGDKDMEYVYENGEKVSGGIVEPDEDSE